VSARTDVLLWAQRIIGRRGKPAHVLLEIGEDATPEEIQEAFHKIARASHPDLHRHGLNEDELELVTSAYAACAGAYQQMRSLALGAQRLKAKEEGSNPPSLRFEATPAAGTRPPQPTPPSAPRTVPRAGTNPPASTTETPASEPRKPRAGTNPPLATGSSPPASALRGSPTSPPMGVAVNAAQAMSSKALVYYRKAELCLKKGDLRGAVLQLKLACSADPTSGFLRTALAEVQAEVSKT
jgi:hypothetical protein